jgi:hypothetical protein
MGSESRVQVTGIPGLFYSPAGELRAIALQFTTDVHAGLVASWQYHLMRPNLLQCAPLPPLPPPRHARWLKP